MNNPAKVISLTLSVLLQPAFAKSIDVIPQTVRNAVALEISELQVINKCGVIETTLNPKNDDINQYLYKLLEQTAAAMLEKTDQNISKSTLTSSLISGSEKLSSHYLARINSTMKDLTNEEKSLSLNTEWKLLSCDKVAFKAGLKS
ncbi:hypothetical protein UA32_12475 [Photobacterium angustum]|uniref:Uncharacterized protein n=1 Tax=Photobacterium angustum TaxID=661 RepID=A0ABX5H1T5_PHOAN|nr:hypothetical protein [Photobacterium angustum]KJG37762.1 hypothetical protein UA32_12475 [Photobacterium angustum]PSX07029.1 hypothetical protein C0W27_15790 [Photobacterium angustum]